MGGSLLSGRGTQRQVHLVWNQLSLILIQLLPFRQLSGILTKERGVYSFRAGDDRPMLFNLS